jgi:hypothetical protein
VALLHVRITVSSHGANDQCRVSVPIRGVNALTHQHGAHAWHTQPLDGELADEAGGELEPEINDNPVLSETCSAKHGAFKLNCDLAIKVANKCLKRAS